MALSVHVGQKVVLNWIILFNDENPLFPLLRLRQRLLLLIFPWMPVKIVVVVVVVVVVFVSKQSRGERSVGGRRRN